MRAQAYEGIKETGRNFRGQRTRGFFASRMHARQPLKSLGWTALTGAVALILASSEASPAPISYRVFNHPDGNQIQHSPDEDGYILRLDLPNGNADNLPNTFNANHTVVTFDWDDDNPFEATLSGIVTHNESGTDDEIRDGADDSYFLSATFMTPLLTDETNDPNLRWYGFEQDDEVYNDMFADLLDDANLPNLPIEEDDGFSADVARIYFELIDLVLTPLDVEDDPIAPLHWDEFPNDPDDKQFFIQYKYRLTGSEFMDEQFNTLAASGWLEPYENGGSSAGAQDLLFITGKRPRLPEPSVVYLFGVGLAGLAWTVRRRDRRG